MKNAPTIGTEVVNSKGGYRVGRTGNVVNIDTEKNRAQIEWHHTRRTWASFEIVHPAGKTWVKFEVIEPTSIPYEILEPKPTCRRTGRMFYPTYQRLA